MMGLQQVLRKYESDFICMILSQLITVGLFLLSKVSLDNGTFVFALQTYRVLAATLSVAPVAYFTDRNLATKMSWKAWVWIFISSLFGTAMSSLTYYGIQATSASFASNFNAIIPIATFILSVAIRLEKLQLGTRHGRIKIAGAILGLSGAVIVGLYKGKSLNITLNKHHHHNSMRKLTSRDMTRGSLIMAASCLSTASWFIIQVKVYEVYPVMSWTVFWGSLASCIQSAIIGIAMDRRKSSWRLGWNLQLVTILYSGAFSTGVYFLQARTAARRGPTYPPSFAPLAVILITVLESVFLGELLYVGSIAGMLLIFGGLYVFLWGKRNEPKMSNTRVEEEDDRDDASALELALAQSNQAILEERREESL